jgi:regulator of ribonuclease activity A
VDRGTADYMDERGEGVDSCDLQLRQYGGRAEFEGPIRTLRCHEDIALLRQLVAEPGGGAVLVVDGGASLHCALVGDQLADRAARNGWAGMVIAGAVRDTRALTAVDLGIKALGTNPRRGPRAAPARSTSPSPSAARPSCPGSTSGATMTASW